jgi:hypothetical protein
VQNEDGQITHGTSWQDRDTPEMLADSAIRHALPFGAIPGVFRCARPLTWVGRNRGVDARRRRALPLDGIGEGARVFFEALRDTLAR